MPPAHAFPQFLESRRPAQAVVLALVIAAFVGAVSLEASLEPCDAATFHQPGQPVPVCPVKLAAPAAPKNPP